MTAQWYIVCPTSPLVNAGLRRICIPAAPAWFRVPNWCLNTAPWVSIRPARVQRSKLMGTSTPPKTNPFDVPLRLENMM